MDNFRNVSNELRSEWRRLYYCLAFRDFRPFLNEDGLVGSSDEEDKDSKDNEEDGNDDDN
jgi:hypothetical protein